MSRISEAIDRLVDQAKKETGMDIREDLENYSRTSTRPEDAVIMDLEWEASQWIEYYKTDTGEIT